MRYVMSCSHDSACSLHLVDTHGRKEGCVFRVRKGITTFDYSKEWNIIGERVGRGGLGGGVREEGGLRVPGQEGHHYLQGVEHHR